MSDMGVDHGAMPLYIILVSHFACFGINMDTCDCYFMIEILKVSHTWCIRYLTSPVH